MFNRWKSSTNEKEKRILEYLHTRLIVVSKGLLSDKPPTSPIVSVLQAVIISKPITVPEKPLVLPEKVITNPVVAMDFSSL